MTLPRTGSRRSTGNPWLPEIPIDWVFDPLKRHCTVLPSNVDKKTVDGEVPVRLCNYTDVYYNERIVDSLELMTATASESQVSKFTLRLGDVVVTKDSETPDVDAHRKLTSGAR